MRNKLTLIILSIAIFGSGYYAGEQNQKNILTEELNLLYEYATLLERENMKVYKILYDCCRR